MASMTSSLISAVAARLLRGAVLRTPRFVVLPGRDNDTGATVWACWTVAVPGNGAGRARVDRQLVRFVEAWRVGYEDKEQHDYSAFGAAAAFVMVERPEAVRKALLDLHRSHCRKAGCEACAR